jgi:hypothetical protein
MSIRVYRGKHRELGGPSKFLRLIPWINILALLFTGLLWLFISEDRKDSLTVFMLIFLLAISISHSLIWHGFNWTLTFGVIAYGISFSMLALNNVSGFIYGDISYTYRLGNWFFSVPAILPFLWLAISYLSFTIARRIFFSTLSVSLSGALFSAAALFGFEQIATNAGYWSWLIEEDGVASFLGVPLRFILMSILVSALILFMVGQLSRNDKLSSRPPFTTYLILGFIFFAIVFIEFGLLSNALWVIALMGSLSLAYTVAVIKDR